MVYNCLCTGRSSKQCAGRSCRVCRKKHNSLLHKDKDSNDLFDRTKEDVTRQCEFVSNEVSKLSEHNSDNLQSFNTLHNRNNFLTESYVLLSTCMVKVYDQFDIAHDARVILDSGSKSCFITENFCKILKLPLFKG